MQLKGAVTVASQRKPLRVRKSTGHKCRTGKIHYLKDLIFLKKSQ
jgi:hypothetical protein